MSAALGKGLSALIPDQKSENANSNEGVKLLKINLIKDNTLQPRTNYDESKIDELKASIKEKGILQPILVRQKGDEYEVVAGERRLKAARALGLKNIPVIIKEFSDKEVLVVALVENIQREALSAIEEAQAFQKLIEEFGYTQEDVAQAVSKDRTTISNLLRLLKLPSQIQKSIYNDEISVGHARALLGVESPVRQNHLFQLIKANGLSVREVEKLVREEKDGKIVSSKEKKTKRFEILKLEESLQKVFGTKVEVLAKKDKGKIVVEYYSIEDLDRILKILQK